MSVPMPSDVTLLTEHLTYRPAALIDDIINSINILAFKATEAVERGLLSAPPSSLGYHIPSAFPPSSPEAQAIDSQCKHEIENGVHQLETLLEAKIDKNFDRLEIFALRNSLSVPADVRDWVRLGHYEGLDLNAKVDTGDGPTSESVGLQRRKLREVQKLHSLLLAERAKNEATLRSLKAVMFPPAATKKEEGVEYEGTHPTFAFLQKKGELTGDVKHPVATSTSFALSQIPALRSLLENLKSRLDELQNGDGGKGMLGEEEKSWRRERSEFVEKETRRHLENVRGLELGQMGEVRDGEWQGQGSKLGKGEVEDLERVVGMIGRGQGDPMDQS